ncbi:AAA family ATPase [Fusobacterium necrophorum]|uniref:AAA family ATPase n=1 Tax=Fusobacterium necrophorum TaxID=859 RepID=UPI00370F2CBF
MKVKFKNLGPIKNGEFDIRDLKNINLIVGPNNSGKTYLTYLIYTIYKVMSGITLRKCSMIERISKEENITITEEDYQEIISNYCNSFEKSIKRNLPFVFHTQGDFFKEFEVKISLEEEKSFLKELEGSLTAYSMARNMFIHVIKKQDRLEFSMLPSEEKIGIEDIETGNLLKFRSKYGISLITDFLKETEITELIVTVLDSFLGNYLFKNANIVSFPAERSGGALFYKQLLQERSDVLRTLEIKKIRGSFDKISRYSEPINDYIKFLNFSRDFQENKKRDIFLKASKNIQDILGGNIEIKENDIIYKCQNQKELNMELVSSTVKSLAGFSLYLKYRAKKGDIVIIDEPELNLHPENQRKLFRLFALLSNLGIHFILSTHSPIIISELNNELLFQNIKKEKENLEELEQEYRIHKEDYGLEAEKVNIWFLHDGSMELLDKKEGRIDVDTFDNITGEMYNLYNDLLFQGE